MTNRSKAAGTRWETAIVTYLIEHGYPAVERRSLSGVHDKGDIAGLPIVIEAKNCKTTKLAEWVDEAVVEAFNARVRVGVTWHHRRGKASPGAGYVTLTGDMFMMLLDAATGRRALTGEVPEE